MTGPSTKERSAVAASPVLVGNRLALAGVALYFCEWIAIIGAGGIGVLYAPGTSASTVLQGYAGHSNAYAWAAGWFGVVLLGRTLFAIGVRHSLRAAGHDDPLADVGVQAMTVGVAFEVTAYAAVMTAALLADHGGSAATVAGFDSLGFSLDDMLWGASGLAVLALSAATWRSGLFPRVLSILGLVAGTLLLLSGLAFTAPEFQGVHDALQVGVALLWAWMIWSGVLLWMRAPSLRSGARRTT